MQKDITEEHNQDMERIRKFCLMDDDFLSKCLEDNIPCVELMLCIILESRDVRLVEVRAQREIKNLQGRSIRADILAADREGRTYNIELQRDGRGTAVKRARYNSSVIDANITEPGDDYKKLPESYVIFITETDVLHGNKGIYHVDRKIKETRKWFGDASHIIYVNGSYRDDSPLGRLMHDLHCINPADMHYKTLADRVRYFKEEEEGIRSMCKMLEEMRDEAEKRGEKRGIAIGEKRGEKRGERRGEKRGLKKGEIRLASLINALIKDAKQDIIAVVAADADKREEYYKLYHIK